ncbi:HAMP domain-containing histidine kinase [Bacillus cereus group sp. N17]|uniref:sensor histidine kinase n=1 Tax=Bacillus cereus group sp. N17 TaxID=2794589 RepID=UPI0018F379FA|nr:HAMP domain-containing sensor histidine kinase [Bacillus cereus group sp. N17]MBJ8042923.1 HAMP domain-containing histidine kinase [Bacillus cereus group sp. N17]
MKLKITLLYAASIISLIFILFIVQFIIATYFVFSQGSNNYKQSTPENIALEFGKYLNLDNHDISITTEGKNILDANNAWLQIIDSNGNVVRDMYAPNNSKQHYNAKDIAMLYKYAVDGYTYFISEVEIEDKKWSYLIAFPSNKVSRYMIYLNLDNILSFYPYGILISIGSALLCLLIFSYFIARYFAKPVLVLIHNITNLFNGLYTQKDVNKGLFKDVFTILNKLAIKLKNVENDRSRLEIMRQEWITNLTHDLKTPLSSIKGYSELLTDDQYNFTIEERKEYAAVIKKKALYIEQLIGDLRLTYQLKNATLPLEKKDKDIVEIVRELVITCLNNPSYKRKTFDFSTNQQNIILKVDEILLTRAINNIMMNSIVHTPEGTHITVKICNTKKTTKIIIEDNGPGIPKKELEQVFERYFRGSNTKNIEGSGLGLAIAKQIIISHDGYIDIKSEEGKGTCFIITFKH